MKFEDTEEMISLHGLGFLQVKLQGKQRLHVWHPDLPRRVCFQHSAIHDHRFGFNSTVIVGTQINHVYAARPAVESRRLTHYGYLHEGARTKFGNRPWIKHLELDVTEAFKEVVAPGGSYVMQPFVYHSTEPGGDGRVATIMRKTAELTQGAHSLCEVGVVPDADFDRKQWPAARLWEIALEVLGGTVFRVAA